MLSRYLSTLPDNRAPTGPPIPKREESILARKPSDKHTHKNKLWEVGGGGRVEPEKVTELVDRSNHRG